VANIRKALETYNVGVRLVGHSKKDSKRTTDIATNDKKEWKETDTEPPICPITEDEYHADENKITAGEHEYYPIFKKCRHEKIIDSSQQPSVNSYELTDVYYYLEFRPTSNECNGCGCSICSGEEEEYQPTSVVTKWSNYFKTKNVDGVCNICGNDCHRRSVVTADFKYMTAIVKTNDTILSDRISAEKIGNNTYGDFSKLFSNHDTLYNMWIVTHKSENWKCGKCSCVSCLSQKRKTIIGRIFNKRPIDDRPAKILFERCKKQFALSERHSVPMVKAIVNHLNYSVDDVKDIID
jgi:hypothetical protein